MSTPSLALHAPVGFLVAKAAPYVAVLRLLPNYMHVDPFSSINPINPQMMPSAPVLSECSFLCPRFLALFAMSKSRSPLTLSCLISIPAFYIKMQSRGHIGANCLSCEARNVLRGVNFHSTFTAHCTVPSAARHERSVRRDNN